MAIEIINAMLIPALIGFTISAALGPLMIPALRRLKVGQVVRKDGPQTHLKKSGTPVMGGIIFLTGIVITGVIYMGGHPKIVPIMLLTLGFGVIGFLDDYIKVVLKRSMGLKAWQKMILQIIATGLFAYYLTTQPDAFLMIIPFTNGLTYDFGIFNIPLLFIAVLGTTNGTNFTDGLDGLLTSVTILIATFLSVVAIGADIGISPITCAAAGALLGFLIFNVYPASVFMGDTGSLALGGFVIASAYMLKLTLFVPIIGIIYFIEVLSVILQVSYFKLTKGKRIFKMAPIHHHFEKCGFREPKIVAAFGIVTALMCIVSLIGM